MGTGRRSSGEACAAPQAHQPCPGAAGPGRGAHAARGTSYARPRDGATRGCRAYARCAQGSDQERRERHA
eukprot:3925453-Heterocapsa_arctica.AAC.1